MIKLVKVRQEFYDLCKKHGVDKELLFNECGRPCVLLIKLKYRDAFMDFVVPMRSNISPKVPEGDYFPLPPNSKTKPRCRHGVHYIKIFPVDRQYVDSYLTEGNTSYSIILNILNNNEKDIVRSCQEYLHQCEDGDAYFMTPDIDGILKMIDDLQNAHHT